MEKFNIAAAAGKRWLGQNTNDKSEFPGRRPKYNASRPEPETETEVAIIPNEANSDTQQEGLF